MSLPTANDDFPFVTDLDEQALARREGAYDHWSMQRAGCRRQIADLPGLTADKQAALDAAMSQIDRAFGAFDRTTGRRLPKAEVVALYVRAA